MKRGRPKSIRRRKGTTRPRHRRNPKQRAAASMRRFTRRRKGR